MDLITRVIEVLSENLGIEEKNISTDSELEADLNMDGLDKIEIVFALEEEFGISLPEEEMDACTTVAEVVNMIQHAIE